MNWLVVAQSAVAGIAVSWPVFLAGLWSSSRKTRRHIGEVTDAQTRRFAELTDAQTGALAEISGHRGSPGGAGGGQYHGHEDKSR